MMERPEDYFARINRPFSPAGSHIRTGCPVCGGTKRCLVNRKTFLWDCKACNAKGNEIIFKRHLGHIEEVSSAVPKRSERQKAEARKLIAHGDTGTERLNVLLNSDAGSDALEWLKSERGFTQETIDHVYLGWRQSPPSKSKSRSRGRSTVSAGPGWVSIPAFDSFDSSGRPEPSSAAMVKLRSVPPMQKDFRRVEGGESVLYFPNKPDPKSTLLIVGGEFDALSVHQAGWKNVCAPTTGEGGWTGEFTGALEGFEDIVVIFDNDDAGKQGASKVIKSLGWWRCRRGSWPRDYKDANECLVALGEEFNVDLLNEIVRESEEQTEGSMVKIGDLEEILVSKRMNLASPGRTTGIADLDDLVGGFRDSELWFITGDTGSGKTTFVSQLALIQAKMGVNVLFIPLEMGRERQAVKMMRQNSESDPGEMSDTQYVESIRELDKMPLFMYEPSAGGKMTAETFTNTILAAYVRKGIQLVVLDHLNWATEGEDEERKLISKYLKAMSDIAKRTGITFVTLVHPVALQGQDRRDDIIIGLSHIKGSSSIKQFADIVLSVSRARRKDRSTEADENGLYPAIVYSMKGRSAYSDEGRIPFKFWKEAEIFVEAPVRVPT